ncbi:MAG: hypothetical protein MUC97_12420 [Bernardetiaceae bacterium]|nr:hypothetical protein [Bernardetiaceae bacterium]
MSTPSYLFPVSDEFEALEVTAPDYDIRGYEDRLEVDLDEVRGDEYKENIYFRLGIKSNAPPGQPIKVAQHKVKILFSGYRGSGKTLTLRNMRDFLNRKERYLAILLELEEVMDLAKFQPEDFYVLIISQLIKELVERQIRFASNELKALAKDWQSEKEVSEEATRKFGFDLEVQNEQEFFGFLGLHFKGIFSSETKTSSTIRQKIKGDTPGFIDRLNLILDDLRLGLAKQGKTGRDIVFLFDGSEKLMKEEVYRAIFVDGASLLRDLNLHLIAAVPLKTFYNAEYNAVRDFYQQEMLPMLQVNKQSEPLLRSILTRRLSEKRFFGPKALAQIIAQSGGSIRQMLKITNAALLRGQGRQITEPLLREVLAKLGQELYDTLTVEDKDYLQGKKYLDAQGKLSPAEPEVWRLISQLILFRYPDGSVAINPLLVPFFVWASNGHGPRLN